MLEITDTLRCRFLPLLLTNGTNRLCGKRPRRFTPTDAHYYASSCRVDLLIRIMISELSHFWHRASGTPRRRTSYRETGVFGASCGRLALSLEYGAVECQFDIDTPYYFTYTLARPRTSPRSVPELSQWASHPSTSNVTPVTGVVESCCREFCCLELTSTRLVRIIVFQWVALFQTTSFGRRDCLYRNDAI